MSTREADSYSLDVIIEISWVDIWEGRPLENYVVE